MSNLQPIGTEGRGKISSGSVVCKGAVSRKLIFQGLFMDSERYFKIISVHRSSNKLWRSNSIFNLLKQPMAEKVSSEFLELKRLTFILPSLKRVDFLCCGFTKFIFINFLHNKNKTVLYFVNVEYSYQRQ